MKEIEIFIVWDMNADSWSGRITMKSLHQTLEGAEAMIPDSLKKGPYDRTRPDDHYIKHYTYFAIEKRLIGA